MSGLLKFSFAAKEWNAFIENFDSLIVLNCTCYDNILFS